jgi:hypothetical protein
MGSRDSERMFAFEDKLLELKSLGEEIAKMLNSLIKSVKIN